MAVTTTLAVIAGVTFLGTVAYDYYNSAQEKKELRKQEIEYDIQNYNALISVFEDLKTKFKTCIGYFEAGKTDFKNGGHVYEGVPLANTEFNNSVDKLNASIETINQLINAYENEIKKLENEKANL